MTPAPPLSFDPPLALAPGETLTVTQDHEGLFALILTTASGETIELPFARVGENCYRLLPVACSTAISERD